MRATRHIVVATLVSLALTLALLLTGMVAASEPGQPPASDSAILVGEDVSTASSVDVLCSSCAAASDFDCGNVTEIPDEECQSLVALFNATDGPNWSNSTDWLQTDTPCDWYGVTCEGGHVTDLRLSRNQLTGTIPTDLDSLSSLTCLDLSWNQLTGSIPPALGNLTDLTSLNLMRNELGGPIPAELGDLGDLRGLNLRGNQLTGVVPLELGSLTSLMSLDLSANRLSGNIHPALGNLINLTELDLSENELEGSIPRELGDMTKVTYVNLSENHLSGSIPRELGKLTNLVGLYLRENRLDGSIPPELGDLASLVGLVVDCNALEGEIPAAIANLSTIGAAPGSQVDFGFNKLSASDPALIAFLDQKDPDWAATQTVPPTDLQVAGVSAGRVELTWSPISYTADSGCYEVWYSQTSGGPYEAHADTADKTASGKLVTGLERLTTYHFVVRTHTPTHRRQQNELWSDYSAEVTATTAEFFYYSLPTVMSR